MRNSWNIKQHRSLCEAAAKHGKARNKSNCFSSRVLDVSLPSSCSLYTCFAFQSCFLKVLRRRSALEAPRIMFCHWLPSSFFNDPARKQKKIVSFCNGAPIQRRGEAARPQSVGERAKKKERQRLEDERSQRKFLSFARKWALRSPRVRAGPHFSRRIANAAH